MPPYLSMGTTVRQPKDYAQRVHLTQTQALQPIEQLPSNLYTHTPRAKRVHGQADAPTYFDEDKSLATKDHTVFKHQSRTNPSSYQRPIMHTKSYLHSMYKNWYVWEGKAPLLRASLSTTPTTPPPRKPNLNYEFTHAELFTTRPY